MEEFVDKQMAGETRQALAGQSPIVSPNETKQRLAFRKARLVTPVSIGAMLHQATP